MIKNFFKVAFRNLFRNKGFSIINISGLVVGMSSAILILLWIQNELSYDRFYKDQDRLYEVWGNDVYDGQIKSGTATPEIMSPVLKNDVPQIEEASRYDWGNDFLFTVGDKSLKAHGNIADADFLSIFSFPLLQGDKKTVLNDPYSIVLTEKLAKKIFGNENPMGKVIKIKIVDDENFKITGILKNLPNNTGFDFEWLMP